MKCFYHHPLHFFSLALCLPLYIFFKKQSKSFHLSFSLTKVCLLSTADDWHHHKFKIFCVNWCFSGILCISCSCFQISQLPTTVIINFLHFTKTVKISLSMSLSEHDLKHYLVENSNQIFLNFLPLYCYFTFSHSVFFPDAIQKDFFLIMLMASILDFLFLCSINHSSSVLCLQHCQRSSFFVSI